MIDSNTFVDSYLSLRKEANAEITVARPKIRMKKDELDGLLRFFMEHSKSHDILKYKSFHPVWERLIKDYYNKTYFKFDLGEGAWIEAVLVKFEEVL